MSYLMLKACCIEEISARDLSETMRLNHRSLFVQISVVKIEHNVNDRRIPSLNELQSIMESSTERESIGSECSTPHVSLS